jgi:GWxTD domain-containing protein
VDEPPFRSEGDVAFVVDVSAYRGPETGSTDLELYLAVSNDQLEFRPEGAGFTGDLLLEVDLRDGDDERAASLETSLQPRAANEVDSGDRGIVQIIRERVVVPPGEYRLQVTLTDRSARKTGLWNVIRGNVETRGRAVARIRVPELTGDGLALSDLTLIRSTTPTDGKAQFGRGNVDFDPNPSRFYGVVLPTVRFYVEMYGGDRYENGDSFLVHTQVTDGSGLPVLERRSRVVPAEEMSALTDALDLDAAESGSRVRAGRHELSVVVMNERTRDVVRAHRAFDVMWSVTTWVQASERLLQEMALVMTDEELDTLEKLSPAARQIYLAEFWHGLDPTPGTEENEIFETFQRRIRLADRDYSEMLKRGILTDRGRVLVRFGPPDEIDYRDSGADLPRSGSERITDPWERVGLSNRPSRAFLDPEEYREGDVTGLSTQRGGATIKQQQLEIWSYDGRGDPLRPGHQNLTSSSHRGLKFIFADRMGNGEYRLVGSQGANVY